MAFPLRPSTSGGGAATPLHLAVREPDRLRKLMAAELPGFIHDEQYRSGKDGAPGLLHCAVLAGSVESTQMILEAGADINEQDAHGRTALAQACSEGVEDLAQFLVEAGADCNVRDNDGQNCAHCAFCMEHLELGDWLVHNTDVDTSALDADGRTPLDWKRLYEQDAEDDEEGWQVGDRPTRGEGKEPDTSLEESKEHDARDPDLGEDHDIARLAAAKKESSAFIINGEENNFAAGTGLRALRWLRRSDNNVICCDDAENP